MNFQPSVLNIVDLGGMSDETVRGFELVTACFTCKLTILQMFGKMSHVECLALKLFWAMNTFE